MPRVWLSLGSNLERERSLRGAVAELRRHFGELILSRVYESEAVGSAGPPFYNMVVGLDSGAAPEDLNRCFHAIEQAHGRERGPDRFAPRTLDIDMLTYGDLVMHEGGIELPRDEILRYAFVLRPLAELAGEVIHPLQGVSYAELWRAFDQDSQPMWEVDLDLSPMTHSRSSSSSRCTSSR